MRSLFELLFKNSRIFVNPSFYKSYTRFFYITDTFVSNIRLKLAKNQAKAKQHTEAKILLFESFSLSLSMLSSKNDRKYSKKYSENKYICLNEVI